MFIIDFNPDSIRKLIEEMQEEIEKYNKLNYEQFNDEFKVKIDKSKLAGKNGWCISKYFNSLEIDELLNDIKINERKGIKYFFYDEESIIDLINEIEEKYSKIINLKLYFNKFIKKYKIKDYFSAAFFISAILENRIKTAFKTDTRKKMTDIIKIAIEEKKNSLFKEIKNNEEYSLNLYVYVEYIPSFYEYISRTYIEDANTNIDKIENEPSYFNRNWLMHGRRTKPVKKYEVLQLLNALNSVECIIDVLDNYNLSYNE